ncbi:MAG: zf-TFIIB domain-containing protein [Melioribacteraceae bacterium]|nr:zf-TFIIB domain-containing protein [Melioribacteraceae bacterium]
MNCPKCKSDLVTFTIDGIDLEQCNKCEGMWFDKNELRRVKDKADSDLNWLDFEVWEHTDKFKAKAQKYNCPKCDERMEVLDYDNTNIEIDFCKSCEGIWLDKGGFEKLIEALEEDILNKSLDEYVKATLEEAKELINGPESFISEWKDFSTIMRFLQYRILSLKPEWINKLVSLQNNPLNR